MRLAVAIILTALAAGCSEEIGRGELRPDGSQFASGRSAGAKNRPEASGQDWWTGLWKGRDTEKSPKPDFYGIRRPGAPPVTLAEEEMGRSSPAKPPKKPESSKPASPPEKE